MGVLTKTEMQADLIGIQYDEFHSVYNVSTMARANGEFAVDSMIAFSIDSPIPLEDCFSVRITISRRYPTRAPCAFEIGGRIPPSYHKNPDGSLCLGPSLDVERRFQDKPSLLGFTEGLLVPFLYGFSCTLAGHEPPFGQYAHGGAGLVQFYMKEIGLTSGIEVERFLRTLANGVRGHWDCPCGSNRRVRACYGPKLLELAGLQDAAAFEKEVAQVDAFIRNLGRA